MVVGEKPIPGRLALRLADWLQTIPRARQSRIDALPVDGNGGTCEQAGAFVSIYLDDLICSANNEALLQELYEGFLQACEDANLTPNPTKLVAPTSEIVVFNCDLRHGFAQVTPERIARYFEEPRTAASQRSFVVYCAKVSEANTV
jgi:hypothetical protein